MNEELKINVERSYRKDLVNFLLYEFGYEKTHRKILDWDGEAYVPFWELNALGRIFLGQLEGMTTGKLASRTQDILGLETVCKMLNEVIENEESKMR